MIKDATIIDLITKFHQSPPTDDIDEFKYVEEFQFKKTKDCEFSIDGVIYTYLENEKYFQVNISRSKIGEKHQVNEKENEFSLLIPTKKTLSYKIENTHILIEVCKLFKSFNYHNDGTYELSTNLSVEYYSKLYGLSFTDGKKGPCDIFKLIDTKYQKINALIDNYKKELQLISNIHGYFVKIDIVKDSLLFEYDSQKIIEELNLLVNEDFFGIVGGTLKTKHMFNIAKTASFQKFSQNFYDKYKLLETS